MTGRPSAHPVAPCALAVFLLTVVHGISVRPAFADETTLFRRLIPRTTSTGIVEVRSVMSPLIDSPDPEEKTAELREVRYLRADRFDFFSELRNEEADGAERESHGALLIATNQSAPAAEELFRWFESWLGARPASAFANRSAAIDFEDEFLKQLTNTEGEAWVCRLDGARGQVARAFRERDPAADDGPIQIRIGTHHFPMEGRMREFCDGFERVFQAAFPTTFRTMPSPQRWTERQLGLRFRDDLPDHLPEPPGLGWPSGTTVLRRQRPGVENGETAHWSKDDSRWEATRTRHGVQWEATAVPAEWPIDSLETAWKGRLQLTAEHKEGGVLPSTKFERAFSLDFAWVPMPLPAWEDGIVPNVVYEDRVMFDEDLFLQELSTGLARSHSLEEREIHGLLMQSVSGLGSDGWALVTCRSDSRLFMIAPTAARAEMTNGRDVCAELSRSLD